MKLVVGLGNPGRKYQATRHNVGFVVLDHLASRHGGQGGAVRGGTAQGRKTAFQGETVEASVAGEKCLLLWPHTFMNLSGGSVLAARDFYKIADGDVLIVCDDFNLPLGKLRFRASGSAGGQKGLADIIRRLGTPNVPRLRVGVGTPPAGFDAADYVLGKFRKEEMPEIEVALQEAADAVEFWAKQGLGPCMNRYN